MGLISKVEFQGVRGYRVGKYRYRPNTSCFFYLIGNTLIDTGPPNQWQTVKRIVSQYALEQVVLTHHHEDHGGNAAPIQAEKQIPVYIHPAGLDYCHTGFQIQYYRRLIWGVPKTFEPLPLPETLALRGDMSIVPVHTPGHSPDMTCFWIPEKGFLFTGDLFITTQPRYLRYDENPVEEMRSLQKVLKLDFETVFCSHKGVVPNGKILLREKYEYFGELEAKVRSMFEQGKTVEEIRRKLLGKEDFLSWFSGFHFSKKNLVKAFLEQ